MGRALLLTILLFLIGTHGVRAQEPSPCRPLVFIPGILGTELLDPQNRVVWGDAGSLRNFAQLEIAEDGARPALHAGRPVSAVNVLGPFWTIHQYDSLFDTLKSIGYREGVNLFVFGYDWRQSNFDSADELRRKIENEWPLQGKDFDVLAHSMGGMVAAIYIQNLADPAHVKRVIDLGVPARGSMNAMAELTEGWGGFENFIAGGIPTIRRVMFSFPSLFELFPSYDSCCRLGAATPHGFTPFDPTDIDIWRSRDWIPSEHQTPSRLARLQSALDSARKLRTLMDRPLPVNIEQTVIAGNLLTTKLYLYVDPQNQSWQNWHFSTSVGDGTVPIWSAAGTIGVARTLPAFVDHATIFSDKWVVNLLSRMLNCNSSLPAVAGTSWALSRTKTDKLVEIASVNPVMDQVVVRAGETVHLTLEITTVDPVSRDDLNPIVTLVHGQDTQPLVMRDESTPADVAARTFKFTTAIRTTDAGSYSARITLDGLGGEYTRDVIAVN